MPDNTQPVNKINSGDQLVSDDGNPLQPNDQGRLEVFTSDWLREFCVKDGHLVGPVFSSKLYGPRRYRAEDLYGNCFFCIDDFTLKDLLIGDRRFTAGPPANMLIGEMNNLPTFIVHPNDDKFLGFKDATILRVRSRVPNFGYEYRVESCFLDYLALEQFSDAHIEQYFQERTQFRVKSVSTYLDYNNRMVVLSLVSRGHPRPPVFPR